MLYTKFGEAVLLRAQHTVQVSGPAQILRVTRRSDSRIHPPYCVQCPNIAAVALNLLGVKWHGARTTAVIGQPDK